MLSWKQKFTQRVQFVLERVVLIGWLAYCLCSRLLYLKASTGEESWKLYQESTRNLEFITRRFVFDLDIFLQILSVSNAVKVHICHRFFSFQF